MAFPHSGEVDRTVLLFDAGKTGPTGVIQFCRRWAKPDHQGVIERPLTQHHVDGATRHELNRDQSPFWLKQLTDALDRNQFVNNGIRTNVV